MLIPSLSPRLYSRVTLAALILLCVITVTGAAVRLTGSGLGCPDWPTCANSQVVAPLETHALIEFVNRLFTGVVSVAVILAVLGAFLTKPLRRDLAWLSASLVLGVLAQAILGGLVVLYGLAPIAVMGHFTLSIVLIGSAFALWLRARANADDAPAQVKASLHASSPILASRVALVGLTGALLTGTVVTGAGPHSGDASASRLSFQVHEVARVHSTLVWIGLAASLYVMWWVAQRSANDVKARFLAPLQRFAVILVGQGVLGYGQYFSGVPAYLVGLHVTGAILVWLGMLDALLPIARLTRSSRIRINVQASQLVAIVLIVGFFVAGCSTTKHDASSPNSASSTSEQTSATTNAQEPGAPWSNEPVSPASVPSVFVETWQGAENKGTCPVLVFTSLGNVLDSRPRSTESVGGWSVVFDAPGAPGTHEVGYYCANCGGATFGIAGTGFTKTTHTKSLNQVTTFADGSTIRRGTNPAVGREATAATPPTATAQIELSDASCVYEAYSYLGTEHLDSLVAGLRRVDVSRIGVD